MSPGSPDINVTVVPEATIQATVVGPPPISVAVEPPDIVVVTAANIGPPGPPGLIPPTQIGHTWAIPGVISATDQFPGFYVPISPNNIVVIKRVACRIRTGGSVTFDIHLDDSSISELRNLVATSSGGGTILDGLHLTDMVFIELIPTAAVDDPTDLSVTIVLETSIQGS